MRRAARANERRADDAAVALDELRRAHVVRAGRAEARRVDDELDDDALVVHARVEVARGAIHAAVLERGRELDGVRGGDHGVTAERRAAREHVVQGEADAHHPSRARLRPGERDEEGEGPREMRRHPQQSVALMQRLAHEAHLEVLEIAQPAMRELARARAGAGREVVLLDEEDGHPAGGGVARDCGAMHPAADDEEIPLALSAPSAGRWLGWKAGRTGATRGAGALAAGGHPDGRLGGHWPAF